MKLGIKLFFCITIFFSITFLVGGYSLITYFYENTMQREVENATEQYQSNKFVVQSALLTKGEEWFDGVANGEYDISIITSDMSHIVAFYKSDGSLLYSEFGERVELSELISKVSKDKVIYKFRDIGGRKYILVAGTVTQQDSLLYMVTGIDVEKIVRQQKQMVEKLGIVYAIAIAVSVLLIFGLSAFFVRPIKRLTEMTRKIATGDYQERIIVTSEDEIGQLAKNFNQMADAVEEKMQELSDSAMQKEDFVANFTHELKTPLTSIIGYANRIYQKELMREEQKKAAFYIWNEGMRLEALAHKLMDLILLNRGEFVLQEVQTDLLLKELVDDMEYLVEKKQVSLQFETDIAIIKVEYDLFKTLFLNLVDNSIKAGANHIWVVGTLQQETEQLYYKLQIEDDGNGIPEDEIQRITEAFYMVDKSRSRKQHGAGIGLSLVEKIAKIHNSSLTFESDEKNGTKVNVKMLCRKGVMDE